MMIHKSILVGELKNKVELESEENENNFYIENINTKTFMFAIFAFLSYLLFQIFISSRIPATEDRNISIQHFPIGIAKAVVDIDLDYQPKDIIGQFSISGAFLRDNTIKESQKIPLRMNYRFMYFLNKKLIKQELNEKEFELSFSQDSDKSELFNIFTTNQTSFDWLNMKLEFFGNITLFHAFIAEKTLKNSAFAAHSKSTAIGSLVFIYLFILHVTFFDNTSDKFIQTLSIILAAVGIFTSNPLKFLPFIPLEMKSFDGVFVSLTVSTFKFYLLCQISTIIRDKSFPHSLESFLFIVFSFGNCFVDLYKFSKGYFHVHELAKDGILYSKVFDISKFDTDFISICIDIVYTTMMIIYLALLLFINNDSSPQRAIFIKLTSSLCILASIYRNVKTVKGNNSFLDNSIYVMTYVSSAIFSLYLIHSGGSSEYSKFEEYKERQNNENDSTIHDGDDYLDGH